MNKNQQEGCSENHLFLGIKKTACRITGLITFNCMSKFQFVLKIAGAIFIVVALLSLFTNYFEVTIISISIAVLCFALLAGSKVSQFYHDERTKR